MRPYICARCLSLRAASSTASSAPTNLRTRPAKIPQWQAYRAHSYQSPVKHRFYSTKIESPRRGIAKLAHRRLISVSGPDAAKFLQGLVSNNVRPESRTPYYAAFLDARGRMMADAFSYPYQYNDGWAECIEVDAGRAEMLLTHLKRHKLRSKVELRLLERDELSVFAVWNDDLAINDPSWDSIVRIPLLENGHIDNRAAGSRFGCRVLVPTKVEQEFLKRLDYPLVDSQAYHVRRYLFGIPEGPLEMPPATALPMESNIDLMGGIDFKKGCYVGQELTIRTKHTGVVRKRILPVQLYHDPAELSDNGPKYNSDWTTQEDLILPSGTDIKELAEDGTPKKGRAAGKFLAGIGNVGLALCRLEMMTDMKISAEGGSWKPGTEFHLKLDEPSDASTAQGQVRVKAFVPQWLRERERELWEKGRSKRVE